MVASTLAWSVDGTRGVDFDFVTGAGAVIPTGTDVTDASVNILWKVPKDSYILTVTETRTGANACPTSREISVKVIDNAFDVYADIVTTKDACAKVDPSVVVDVDADGSNSNDVFGLTTRDFLVTAVNATGAWDFTYTLTHKNGSDASEDIGNLSVKDGSTNISFTGQTINVGAGVTTKTITVSYTTNMSRQDKDFDLVLEITAAKDALNTPDGNATGSNIATYNVRAVPATTGILTD